MHEIGFQAKCKYEGELRTLRRSFDALLKRSGIVGTKGTCLFSCLYVRKVFSRFFPEVKVSIRGGPGERGLGIRLPNGSYAGHYWLEMKYRPDLCIGDPGYWYADITADQFGFEETRLVCAHFTLEYMPEPIQITQAQVEDCIAEQDLTGLIV